jgi:hypothetical protein
MSALSPEADLLRTSNHASKRKAPVPSLPQDFAPLSGDG